MTVQSVWKRVQWRFVLTILIILGFIHLIFIDRLNLEYGSQGTITINFRKKQKPGNVDRPTSSEVPVIATPTTEAERKEMISIYVHANKTIVPGDNEEYMAICMAVKDQSVDLPEFFQHHYYNIGFRRFYIMDDGSNPPLSEVPDYGIPREAITFHYFKPEERGGSMQLSIYNHCNEWYGKNHTWIAYIDADEFFEQVTEVTLKEKLKEFEEYDTIGAFGVNWQMHTSSNLVNRPDDNRKAFLECIHDDPKHNGEESDNRHVKSIVRTSRYVGALNPHMFSLNANMTTVGEDGKVIDSYAFRMPITRNLFSLHHYAVKSYEEYLMKLHRSNGMDQAKDWGFWDHVRDIPHEPCEEMLKYNP